MATEQSGAGLHWVTRVHHRLPEGWTAVEGVSEHLLVHPAGLSVGAIRYQSRRRPLAPIKELVARALAVGPGFQPEVVGAARRMVTVEGEYGALVTVEGTADGGPARRDLGFVFHEDHYTRIAGMTADPTHFEEVTRIVEALVHADRSLLGTRPRRAFYLPPPAWYGVARDLVTEWYPPAFPEDLVALTVWPAMPLHDLPEGWWHAALGLSQGFVPDTGGVREVASAHGLQGECMGAARGGEGGAAVEQREIALLRDDRYAYLCRLETAGGPPKKRYREAFAAVVSSLQPIPRGRPDDGQVRRAFDHWFS